MANKTRTVHRVLSELVVTPFLVRLQVHVALASAISWTLRSLRL